MRRREGWPSPVEGSGLEMRAAASRALPLRPRKPCPVRLIVRGRPGLCPAFAADPIALMGNGMGRNSTRGHPSPWAGRARAEAELPHIDPRRGVLSTALGLTRVERVEWLRAKPSRGRAADDQRREGAREIRPPVVVAFTIPPNGLRPEGHRRASPWHPRTRLDPAARIQALGRTAYRVTAGEGSERNG